MNRIGFPRVDVDGREYDQIDLEEWYIFDLNFKDDVDYRLNHDVHAKSDAETRLLKHLQDYLEQILLMPPSRMVIYTKIIYKHFANALVHSPNGKSTSTPFGREILEAFGYIKYRSTILPQLAKWLNVKTCPYCNMSYTLYTEAKRPGIRKKFLIEKFARLQFDHFYDKMSFPMLSMSLYNFIPSCSVCNQGKSSHALPAIFHPYLTDIHSLFSFEVTNPLPGLEGENIPDYVGVDLKWEPSVSLQDRKEFEDTFHLEAMYSRHGDIVKETFYKAIEAPYYTNPANFTFLSRSGAQYLEQLWLGNYTESKDIHRRPLAKFVQDIRKQADLVKKDMDGLLE